MKLLFFLIFLLPIYTSAQTNNLTYSVAWKQTAAEYRALYHQGFNLAKLRVAAALKDNKKSKPLAIISDVDDTLLLTNDYWGFLVENHIDFFDDNIWDQWVAEDRFKASPGSKAFLNFCAENGVEIFYITNRNQGENTFQLALRNLKKAEFPMVDSEHLTVLLESSNKEIVQKRIMRQYEVVVVLGDNLNDFERKYYVTDIDIRKSLVEINRLNFGNKHILFPNPTDGHWIRAIFGDSEPEANKQNREIFQSAATRRAWGKANIK